MAATAIASRVESLVGDLGAVHAPRGTERECKGWHQEAALRMLCNNLDPEVAEDPQRLVVYGGSGRAAARTALCWWPSPVSAATRTAGEAPKPASITTWSSRSTSPRSPRCWTTPRMRRRHLDDGHFEDRGRRLRITLWLPGW